MARHEYQRLTRARSRSAFAVAFMARSSLWLGKDHLLCVDAGGYSETYKRFYFRDIQAISIQQTDRHHWWTAIFGFLAFVFFIVLISTAPKTSPAQWTADEIAGGIVLGGITTLFVLLLLINILKGPACKCRLRTAVQIEELPSLNRVRRARKILERLRPHLAAAQGTLAPEEIAARMRQSVQDTTSQVLSPELETAVPGKNLGP